MPTVEEKAKSGKKHGAHTAGVYSGFPSCAVSYCIAITAQKDEQKKKLTTASCFAQHSGPEIELWLGCAPDTDPALENDWGLLPFMALSDGAHASTEDYSYFTLRRSATSEHAATSLFGISCTRQLDARTLVDRPADVTRSTVQKAVVVISDRPEFFGAVKAGLGSVVERWFAQR